MHQNKNKLFTLRRLMLTASLLLLCVILAVGAAWARYRTEEDSFLQYTTRDPGGVSLWAGYNEFTGTLTAGDIPWTFSNGTGTAQFYLSNGTSETDYSEEDLRAGVRLLVSLNAADAQAELSVSDGDSTATWSGTPVEIQEGTPLFTSFGAGTVYVFQDEAGSELEWELQGGALSVLSLQIDISNLEQLDGAALLQVQVVGK